MSKKLSLTIKLLAAAACIFLVSLLGALAAWLYAQAWLKAPLEIPEQGYVYELKSGHSLGHLAQDLGNDGVLSHPRLLRLYARFNNANKIHAGEYFFSQGTTPKSLLQKLIKGDVVLYQVTFVEGWTAKQALAALEKMDTVQHRLAGKTTAEQLTLLALPVKDLEGWIFPDTYTFSRNTSDVEIVQNAYRKMQSLLDAEWEKRAPNLPYKNTYEALIMASIVERETGHHSERDQIAGVFVRRLQQGMKLQTDPTVIYGMGENYKGRITRKDLEESTAYNTYVIPGLPPTPISLPSTASIKAALNPAPGRSLYFVAKGDGTSEFSDSLEQHNQAVRRYQLNRRSDYRAAPPPMLEK
ncbi:MAG TPA: endolytic transglycosylase MltG [Cellvibrio sp.]|nr:endolytic transglycosylase MltG [Cellvibrio sp.]